MQDLIETAIENIYTKLQKYVGQENLIEKSKCINQIKNSQDITLNDLRPLHKLTSEFQNDIKMELAKKVKRKTAHLFFTRAYRRQLKS